MQKTEIRFPAKCFLWGEYLALYRAKAILATFPPHFTLRVRKGKSSCPFHPESAAGIFWEEKEDFFSTQEILFETPYKIGGLGQSSAEFAALFSLWHLYHFPKATRTTFLLEAYRAYRIIYKDHAYPPSGLDLMAQLLSSSIFHENSDMDSLKLWAIDMRIKEWNEFPTTSLPFLIVATGEKQKTHEHLETLFFDKKLLTPLETILESAQKNLLAYPGTEKEISACLKEWKVLMERAGLLAPHAKKLCTLFSSIPGVWGVKGAGAMGADMLVLFLDPEKKETVIRRVKEAGYKNIYDFYTNTWVQETLEQE